MKRVAMTAMFGALVPALASMATASGASALCLKVLSPGIGNLDSTCLAGSTGDYRSLSTVLPGGRGAVCGKVTAGQGVYTSGTCAVVGTPEEWVKGNYRGWIRGMAGVTVNTALIPNSFTGNYVLLGKPFLVAMHFECTKVHVAGSISNEGTGKAALEFSSCKTTKPSNCMVKEPIVTEVNSTLLTPETGDLEDEFTPKSGTKFTTITLEGASCALKNEPFEVSGSQKCNLPDAETEVAGHEISCLTSGSELKAGGAAATFEGEIKRLETEGKEAWFGT